MRKISIELERLEVVFDANLEKLEAEFNKIVPMIDKTMRAMGMTVNRGSEKVDKSLDISEGLTRMEKQMQGMTAFIKRQTEMMEQQSEKSSNATANNMIKGIAKARKAVGKDVESMVNDINSQMNRASTKQSQIDYLKSQRQGAADKGDTKSVVRYDNQLSTAQAQLTGFEEKAKKIFNSMQQEYKNVTTQIKNSTLEMTKQKDVIAQQKARVMEVNELYNQQARKISLATAEQKRALHTKYQGQGGVFNPNYDKELDKFGYKLEDTKASAKTGAEYRKMATQVNKLIAKYNELSKTQSELRSRGQALNGGLRATSGLMSRMTRQTETAGSGMRKFGRTTDGTRGLISRLNSSPAMFANSMKKGFGVASLAFNGLKNKIIKGNSQINKESRGMTNGLGGISRRMGQIAKQVLIYSMVYRGIRMLSQGLTSALKTNDVFASSLNQIKVNMLTAFYPIYQAVLPAINAMMKGLAVLTGQLSAFISMLFGSTYDASKQGAKGLYDNIQAMNETGSAADKNKNKIKEMQRSLMGFDEINNLSKDKKDDSLEVVKTPGVDFGNGTGSYGVPKWMTDIQNLLKDFFKPFQEAWRGQGQKVMGAWKYALGEVKGLLKSIGKSFMEVWMNGTGQLFIENILVLLKTVLNIVGDIARALRRAWDENGRGTVMIQSIFNGWNGILTLLNTIGESFRNAWNDNGLGQSILGRILEILTDIFETVGNLAEGLEKAWKVGNTGESIFRTILTIADNLLVSIKKITGATSEWAKKLDFTPLLGSIDKLLKSIEPITKKIFDGIAWGYENVFLPLAGFAIEDALPAFFDLLRGALDLLNGVLEVAGPLFEWLWDEMLAPMAKWTGGVMVTVLEDVGSALSGIGDWVKEHKPLIETIAIIVGSFAAAWKLVNIAFGVWNGLVLAWGTISSVAAGATTVFGAALAFLTGPIGLIILAIGALIAIGVLLWKNWDKIKEWASKTWGKIKETITKAATESAKWVGEKWNGIKKVTSETWNNLKTGTSESWERACKTISEKASSAWTSVKGRWGDIRSNTSETWDNVKSATGTAWDTIKDKVSTQAETAKRNASTAFSKMKTSMGESLNGLKTNTEEVFGKIAGWATDLPGKIAKGLTKGVEAIKKAASSIANGMVGIIGKAMNGVIKGINWVLRAVGAGKSTLGDWKIPKYAMGTSHHPGGIAMVNDGSGSNWQEAYQTPDGRQGLFPRQKNLMVDLPKGSSVLSGPRTAKMMAGIPAYAGGIGTWFKEKWDGAKQIASDVWSYAKDPSKLLNAAVSKYVDLKGAVQPALDMAKGTVATVASGATKWVTDKFNIGHESHKNQIAQGSFSGNASIANNGVYSYLMDIAQGLMKKYGMVFTSGFRSGDPYDHGKGLAVDIALPGVVNGSPKYRQAADEAINMAGVKYVITNGMWKHKGQPWTTWPDGDHYDHVHISGNKPTAKPTNDPVSGVRSFGPSVDRWQSTAAKAMRMLGAYSTSNMNATMNQIRTESNGNPNAINLWDINAKNGTPSKGLMQVIDPTFRANARSPYNRNIYDPLSNILASMRYATRTYGSLSNAYKGVGYENGGWVTQDGLYRMGEGGKREMVVPVDKPSLAMERLSQVFDYMGLDWADSPLTLPESFQPASFTEPSRTFASANQNRYEGGGMQQNFETMLNNLMMAIQSIGGTTQPASNGDIVINIGGKEFGRIAVSEINKYQRQVGYNQLEI